jgi:hypothetical protein
MSENKDKKITLPKGSVLSDLTIRIKLILRLMADSRVNPLLKLLPIGAVVYLLFPDLLPGPIDDVAILWLGSYLFVELCPPEVVQEHMEALKQVVPGEWHDPRQGEKPVEGEIVDAEFWEKKEDKQP